jgi:hypothetical protein
MYVSAPTMFWGVTLPPVQTNSFINCAVSGWLDFMKSSTSLRIFSCIVSSIGLGVGAIVGLLELFGVGEEEGAVDDVDVGVGLEEEGRGEVVVGRGEDEGVDEEAEEGVGFGCSEITISHSDVPYSREASIV